MDKKVILQRINDFAISKPSRLSGNIDRDTLFSKIIIDTFDYSELIVSMENLHKSKFGFKVKLDEEYETHQDDFATVGEFIDWCKSRFDWLQSTLRKLIEFKDYKKELGLTGVSVDYQSTNGRHFLTIEIGDLALAKGGVYLWLSWGSVIPHTDYSMYILDEDATTRNVSMKELKAIINAYGTKIWKNE